MQKKIVLHKVSADYLECSQKRRQALLIFGWNHVEASFKPLSFMWNCGCSRVWLAALYKVR